MQEIERTFETSEGTGEPALGLSLYALDKRCGKAEDDNALKETLDKLRKAARKRHPQEFVARSDSKGNSRSPGLTLRLLERLKGLDTGGLEDEFEPDDYGDHDRIQHYAVKKYFPSPLRTSQNVPCILTHFLA